MLELNRALLAADVPADQLGPTAEWTRLLRLRGPGARRLREILAEGRRLGLMALRPVWLLNPDVASSLLPRTPAIFDLVIFDEASQIVVENAVPSLFRARRMVVSGDDKQMPPTSFFASRLEDDEEEGELEAVPDEALSEAELAHYEEAWNRRDIKDCPDLLALARSVVPATTLEIHYRSEYRELIDFSNAAFYRGGLSVPVRHPDELVREVKPIEVIRVDGTYEGQINPAEATRIVELLADYWYRPEAERPSIGVVTFNRKQADLIEDAIQERASADPTYLAAWRRERDRRQAGEDMGFFVKNVENVQVDERDVMVFSTTFGRDRRGSFRRNFGVLGQAGGERRLNVAVTRARSKVILVTSVPLGDVSDYLAGHRPPVKPRDYLQAYLDYAHKVSAGSLDDARRAGQRLRLSAVVAREESGPDDGITWSVERFLRGLGHEPVRVSDGDAFGLDFAIRHPRTGLFGMGIECDAPQTPLLHTARMREVWRPRVLGRTVPVVHRVTSRGWYHRREEEQMRLRTVIESALGEAA